MKYSEENEVPVCSKIHSFLHRISCKKKLFFTNSFIHFSSLHSTLNIFLLMQHPKANNWTPEMRWILSGMGTSKNISKRNETNKWIKKRNKINCRGIILFVLWKGESREEIGWGNYKVGIDQHEKVLEFLCNITKEVLHLRTPSIRKCI